MDNEAACTPGGTGAWKKRLRSYLWPLWWFTILTKKAGPPPSLGAFAVASCFIHPRKITDKMLSNLLLVAQLEPTQNYG